MPSKQQRLLFTPSPEARRVLDALHELTGQSRASIVSELLDTALPALQMTVEAMETVRKGAPDKARDLLSRYSTQAVNDLTQAQLDLDAAVDGRTVKGKRLKRRARHAGGTP
jgi:predicted DNA-binding protein